MIDVREVADKVYRFETPIAGMFYTPVVYLIDAPGGVLIEPGPAAAMPSIQEAMARLGMKDLSYIIPTHIHVDHGGGAAQPGRGALGHDAHDRLALLQIREGRAPHLDPQLFLFRPRARKRPGRQRPVGLLRHDARDPPLLDLDPQAGQAAARRRRDDRQARPRADGLRLAAYLDQRGGANAQRDHEPGNDEQGGEKQEGGLQDRLHSFAPGGAGGAGCPPGWKAAPSALKYLRSRGP